jgi:hypothetical protein
VGSVPVQVANMTQKGHRITVQIHTLFTKSSY